MSEQILENIFDSPAKVKLLKLFLRNPQRQFLISEAVKRTQCPGGEVAKHIKGLESIHFLKAKTIRTNKAKGIVGGAYYSVNTGFDFYPELQRLVLKSSPTSKSKMLRRIMKLGRIKLALIGGVFLNTDNSRVDLFLVGEDISEKRLRNFLTDIESEVGKEIEYAAMSLNEFDYRFHMFDRFIRDILEKPNEKLVNKIKFVE